MNVDYNIFKRLFISQLSENMYLRLRNLALRLLNAYEKFPLFAQTF